jgi:hypothetical protein
MKNLILGLVFTVLAIGTIWGGFYCLSLIKETSWMCPPIVVTFLIICIIFCFCALANIVEYID